MGVFLKGIFFFRYKIILYALEIVNNTITGNYVNFGVFTLYNDTCFVDVCKLLFQLIVTSNLEELKVRGKENFIFVDVP